MRHLKAIKLVLIFLLLLGLAGCKAGGEPSDGLELGPTPPAEIPTFLSIPSDISIDLSQISAATTSISVPKASGLSKAVGTGNLSNQISIGPGLIEEVNIEINRFLTPLSSVQIDVGLDVTTWEAELLLDPDRPESLANFKFDFNKVNLDVDIDGDGVPDECSGCTCPVGCAADGLTSCEGTTDDLKPICIRIWRNDERYMGMVMVAFPTNGNPGAGGFRFTTENIEYLNDYILVGALYNHVDPNNKSTEIFSQSKHENGDIAGDSHVILSEILTDAGVEKSVFANINAYVPPYNLYADYISKFIEGGDFVGLHLLQQWDDVDDVDPAVCAQISTASETDMVNCTNLGIDVTGIPFIDSATEADYSLPSESEFPLTPPF